MRNSHFSTNEQPKQQQQQEAHGRPGKQPSKQRREHALWVSLNSFVAISGILSFRFAELTQKFSTGGAPNEQNDGYYNDQNDEAMVDDDEALNEESKSAEEDEGEDLDENLEK